MKGGEGERGQGALQSRAINVHQDPSRAIRGHQGSSRSIKVHQGDQRQSRSIKVHQGRTCGPSTDSLARSASIKRAVVDLGPSAVSSAASARCGGPGIQLSISLRSETEGGCQIWVESGWAAAPLAPSDAPVTAGSSLPACKGHSRRLGGN